MSVVSIFCFAFAGLLLTSLLSVGTDRLSPLRIFLGIWSVAIGLADLKLSGYQSEWSTYAWTMLGLGILSFAIGYLVIAVRFLNTQLLSIREIRLALSGATVQSELLFRVIIAFFVLFVSAFALEVNVEGNVPLFSARPDKARVDFGVFGLHLIVAGGMPLLLFLIVEYYVFVRNQRRKKIVLALVFVATALSFFLLLQRFPYLIAVVMIIALLYHASDRLRPSRVIFSVLLFFGFMFLVQSLRLVRYVQDYIYVISKMKYSIRYAAFTEPYMYIVMNLENFCRSVKQLESHTLGYFTADFLLALTGLKHWMASYFGIVERPFLTSGYNTYPFMWTYYYDFGPFGVALVPFILGMGVGQSYYSLRTRPTITLVMLNGFSLFFIVISFFTNPLTMLNTFFTLFLLLVVHRFIMCEKAHS
jgi:oligosaccharide repeat unit polymerase